MHLTFDAVLAVVRENSGLLELRIGSTMKDAFLTLHVHNVDTVLACAPQLHVFEASVAAKATDARRMLRNEGALAPLRVRRLGIFDLDTHESILTFAADVSAHPWVTELMLMELPLLGAAPALLDAVVDAALARNITSILFLECALTPACAPALARLLHGGVLREFVIINDGNHMIDETAAALLAPAFRASTALTAVSLDGMDLWHDPAAATTLLTAFVAHPSLRELGIINRRHLGAAQLAAAGAAIGAVVAANAPALRVLDVGTCELGDVGLLPLLDALPANTHLQELDLVGNHPTHAFVRERLLPSVRANGSLHHLSLQLSWASAVEAEAVAAGRAPPEL